MSACEWNPDTNRLAWSTDPPHAPAVVNVRGYEGGIHLCASCAALPRFRRYTARTPLPAPHAILVGGDGGPRSVEVGVLPSPAMAAPKNPRGGRPAKQGGPTTPYTIKLSEERRMRWEALARLRDVDLSDLVRESTDAACEAAGIVPVPAGAGPDEPVRPGARADALDAAAARGEGVFVLRRLLESFDPDTPGPDVLAARTLAVALAISESSGAPGEAPAWRVWWRPSPGSNAAAHPSTEGTDRD